MLNRKIRQGLQLRNTPELSEWLQYQASVMLFLPIVNRSVFVTDEKPNTARNYHVASLVEIVL